MTLTADRSDLKTSATISSRILGIGTAVPAAAFTQSEILRFILDHFDVRERTKSLYRKTLANPSIEKRHFSLEALDLVLEKDHDLINRRFESAAIELSKNSLKAALDSCGAAPASLDFVAVTTCTGYLCPGISSHLVEQCGLRRDVHTLDITGMGCGAAIPALEQAYNFTQAHPGALAAVVSTEICSAAMFSNDAVDIVISNTLFSDGSAALLLRSDGEGTPSRNGFFHPRIAGFSSLTLPEWRETLRFQTSSGHLKNVLGKQVPQQAAEALENVVEDLLKKTGKRKTDISRWILHAGGEKIISSVEQRLRLHPRHFHSARNVLRQFGNMSSPTVLFVMKEDQTLRPPEPGETAVISSFGAGFSAYAALLQY